ncbi:hypothetical protein Emed_005657 [Eimeria media]
MAPWALSICLWCLLLCLLPAVSPDQSLLKLDCGGEAAATGCSCCVAQGLEEESHARTFWTFSLKSVESFLCRTHRLLCEALYWWRLDDREVFLVLQKWATAHSNPTLLKPQPSADSITSDETNSNTRHPLFPCAIKGPLRGPLDSSSHVSGSPARRLSEPVLASLEEPRTLASLCLLALASFVAVATGTGGHCLPAWAVALLLTALSLAMTIKAAKHHGAFTRCMHRWRCCRRRPVEATEAEVRERGEEDDAASHSKRYQYTKWASRIVSHLVPPVSNQQGGVHSPDESLPAGGLSVQISCQAQQERRQPWRTRTQGIASMLDMRVDSGVWLLHPGDEAIETPGVPPAASNVVSPPQHAPSNDDPRAPSSEEAEVERGSEALQQSGQGEGQTPGAHSDFCRPAEDNVNDEERRPTRLVTEAEARQSGSVRDLQAESVLNRRHWGDSPESAATLHAARTPPSKRGRVERKKASLACRELPQRRMNRLKRCGLACCCMRNTTDAAENHQGFEGSAEGGEVHSQRKVSATRDELRVLPDVNRLPFKARLAPRSSSVAREEGKHAVDDNDRQMLPDNIQQALETKREGEEASRYAGGHRQENEDRQGEAQGETFCSEAHLLNKQSRASFPADHQEGSTCLVSPFCSPSAHSPRRSSLNRPPSTRRGSLASLLTVEPESSSSSKANAPAARHTSLSSLIPPVLEEASKPQLQADEAAAQTEGSAIDATKCSNSNGLLMATVTLSAQGRPAEEQRRQRLEGHGQRASASPTEQHITKRSRSDPSFHENTCGYWSCGEPQEDLVFNNVLGVEEKANFDEFSDDKKDVDIPKRAFSDRLEAEKEAAGCLEEDNMDNKAPSKPQANDLIASAQTLRLVVVAQRVDDPLLVCVGAKRPYFLRTKTAIRNLERQHSIGKWMLVTVIWAIYVALGFIRGNLHSPTQLVEFCGVGFWLLFLLANTFALVCSYGRGLVMWALQREKDVVGVEAVQGDMHYSMHTVNTFFLQTVFSGALGCTVGVGGGMFLGPLMLLNGMVPAVAQATNSAAIMFSSSSGLLYSLYSKNIPWDLVAVLYGVSCLSAIAGKVFVNFVMRSPKWSNQLSLLLVFSMVFATTAMIGRTLSIWTQHNDIERFRSPCES